MDTHSAEIVFENREEAGRLLAVELAQYAEQSPVVLELPRGGIVVAYEVATALRAPLDVAVARKLGAPGQEELGIGAVAAGGVCVLDEQIVRWLGVGPEEVRRAITRETHEVDRRIRLYRGCRPPLCIEGRNVILIDDGVATGVSVRAAVEWMRVQKPSSIVVATPVCAPDTAARMRPTVDNLVCLSMPADFRAAGLWYRNFDQVPESTVIELLNRAARAAQTT